MKEKNSIDNLFKTGVSGFTIEPSDQVWKNVQKGYFGKKGFAFFKWYYLGAALFLLLLTTGGLLYFGSDSNSLEVSSSREVTHFNNDIHSVRIDDEPNNVSKVDSQGPIPNGNSTNSTKDEDFATNLEKPANNDKTDKKSAYANRLDQSFDEAVIFSQNQHHHDGNEVKLTETVQFKTSETSGIQLDNIHRINSRTVAINLFYNANLIDPETVIGLEAYLKKQRISHFYTAASINAGMVYYPATKDQFTWSADLSFGITAGKFYFETGIGYQDMKERGIYAIDLKSYDSVGFYNQVESFEIDPQNPGQIIYNTNKVSVYDSIDHYTHSTPLFRYKYLNIPFNIGYKILQKQNFSVSLNTGLLLSMLVEKDIPDAEYQDPDYTTVSIQNNTPERVDWNLRLQLALRLNYTLYKSLSVSAEPNFSKYMNTVYNTDKGYENVKPYTMGIRIGIYYGF